MKEEKLPNWVRRFTKKPITRKHSRLNRKFTKAVRRRDTYVMQRLLKKGLDVDCVLDGHIEMDTRLLSDKRSMNGFTGGYQIYEAINKGKVVWPIVNTNKLYLGGCKIY